MVPDLKPAVLVAALARVVAFPPWVTLDLWLVCPNWIRSLAACGYSLAAAARTIVNILLMFTFTCVEEGLPLRPCVQRGCTERCCKVHTSHSRARPWQLWTALVWRAIIFVARSKEIECRDSPSRAPHKPATEYRSPLPSLPTPLL